MQLPEEVTARFEVAKVLGRGAYGVVVAAKERRTGRLVAIKLFAPQDPSEGEVARARFLREAELTARIRHPNVVDILDFGEAGTVPFMVCEFVSGSDLARLLHARTEGLPAHQVLTLGEQLLAGLAAIHQAGVMHRDLKPPNILIDNKGRLRITDLGLGRPLEGSDLTRQGALVGTPAYAPLEQYFGAAFTPASDVYAAGLLLYQMLTLEPLYRNRSPEEIFASKRTEEAYCVPVTCRAPAYLRDLVASMTSPHVVERPSDGAAALVRLRAGRDGVAPRPPPENASPPVAVVAPAAPARKAIVRRPDPPPPPTIDPKAWTWGRVARWVLVFCAVEAIGYWLLWG